ncbi:HEPN-associated N-terminal domain-containing protein [Asinibacterium sp. OR53]|uniref:HEPN-associated N-terminal domain-containing protein n=1 Tax=Asinibacterium sp. OR53 TaxID=925409 RepID=UPI0004796F5F|nr:HEPN-associated N-terminal domain-containing protein [Asinibacterium sp. OR53]
MSGVDQEQQDLWTRGLSGLKDTFVCSSHIHESAIINFIKRNSKKGNCSYCKRSKNVIPFERLMFFMMEGIMNFYEDAAEFMSYDSSEGGYLGETYTQWELINDEIALEIDNYQLNEDIIDCIDDRAWSEPNRYYDSDSEILVYHCDYFKDVTKHKSRYLFGRSDNFKSFSYNQNAYDILDEIGSKVKEFGLIKHISQKVELFRCRQHSKTEKIFTASQIASPPDEYALYPNRMSPAGISMFYCAFNSDTAIAETLDTSNKDKDHFTVVTFKPERVLSVIDFSDLPVPPSIFDLENFKDYYSTRFLKNFVADISQTIKRDGKEHIDYVPTQIVTEYFRYIFDGETKIDGLIYPSAKIKNSKCCVLFFDSKQSLKELKFMPLSLVKKAIV